MVATLMPSAAFLTRLCKPLETFLVRGGIPHVVGVEVELSVRPVHFSPGLASSRARQFRNGCAPKRSGSCPGRDRRQDQALPSNLRIRAV